MRSGRCVVLVEGVSDQLAVETLARRQGRNLAGDGVLVLAMGGAQALGRFLGRFDRSQTTLAGLCDAGEEPFFRRELERAGFGTALTRAGMERLGFYVCDLDLEDELIRCLGPCRVIEAVEAEGDLAAFETFRKQPAWRGRPVHSQLRRFLGSGARRKLRYAEILVEALDPGCAPRPLEGVLAHCLAGGPAQTGG